MTFIALRPLVEALHARFDSLKESIYNLHLGRVTDRVWWLLMSAALLGIMGRAFKWI